MGEPKTIGGYYFQDWDKDGKTAEEGCGGRNALGAAQKWAKENGRKVPTGINNEDDAQDLIDNCRAYEDSKKQKPKKEKPKKEEKKIEKVDEPDPFVGKNAAGEGLTQAEFDLYSQQTIGAMQHGFNMELQDSINSSSLAIQNLANEASAYGWDTQQAMNVYSQDAESWRTQYAYDAQERWNKFDSVMDYKAATDSAKIQGEYSLGLGAIMNAGNAEVAKINGEYSTANTALAGEYGIAGEKIRANASRDVAQRNKEATMFGSFLGGFWS